MHVTRASRTFHNGLHETGGARGLGRPQEREPVSARLPSPLGGVVGRTEIVFRRRIAFVSSSEPRDSLTPNALGPLHLPGLLAREANS
jgi:hypothetical protein